MNGERVVSVLIAVACIAAMGVASTTMQSSLSSTPDDAVKFNYDDLPIGQDQAHEVKQEVDENEQKQQSRETKKNQQQQRRQKQQTAQQQQDDEQSFLEWLLALLKSLLPLIGAILGAVVVAALLWRYWRRLGAPVFALVPSFEGGGRDDERVELAWEPRDDVERTWLDLLQSAGIDRPHAKTPERCAEDAVAAGYDAENVHGLRRVFEEARYGPGGTTDAHRERAETFRNRLGLGGTR